MMSIDIQISGLAPDIQKALETALSKTMEVLRQDVVDAQVMPRDQGAMQNNQTYAQCRGLEGNLITDSPQARRLYYHPEYNFQQGHNKNAGGEWLEPWLNGQKKTFVRDTMEQILKKELGT